jgi:hypothetical protein
MAVQSSETNSPPLRRCLRAERTKVARGGFFIVFQESVILTEQRVGHELIPYGGDAASGCREHGCQIVKHLVEGGPSHVASYHVSATEAVRLRKVGGLVGVHW